MIQTLPLAKLPPQPGREFYVCVFADYSSCMALAAAMAFSWAAGGQSS